MKTLKFFVKWIKDLFIKKKPVVMEGIEERTYMIFIYGDFKDKEDGIEDLALQLVPIVSSDFIKYNYGEHGVVVHFSTKEDFNDLKEYIDMVFNGIIEQYFLLERTDNFEINMPKKLKDDLLLINNKKDQGETKNGKIDLNNNFKSIDNEKADKIFSMFVPLFDPSAFVFDPYEIYEPTVDDILDKISEKGIDSLTKEEKEILENYGKRENGRAENE